MVEPISLFLGFKLSIGQGAIAGSGIAFILGTGILLGVAYVDRISDRLASTRADLAAVIADRDAERIHHAAVVTALEAERTAAEARAAAIARSARACNRHQRRTMVRWRPCCGTPSTA